MAKVQFNRRLEEATVEKINAEVERLSKLHGFVVSQGDVIELRFAGPIVQSSKKLSKREQKIAAIRAQDPMADHRPDIEYGSDELPSAGSVARTVRHLPSDLQAGEPVTILKGVVRSIPNWRAGRKPLLKPSERKKCKKCKK